MCSYYTTCEISSANMGFWSANIAILHGSTTDCTAASARGQTTVKCGRINGGKLILSLIYLSYDKSFITQLVI